MQQSLLTLRRMFVVVGLMLFVGASIGLVPSASARAKDPDPNHQAFCNSLQSQLQALRDEYANLEKSQRGGQGNAPRMRQILVEIEQVKNSWSSNCADYGEIESAKPETPGRVHLGAPNIPVDNSPVAAPIVKPTAKPVAKPVPRPVAKP